MHLLCVGKSVLILMMLILIHKFFEPRYVLRNLKVKNRKNFLDNLLHCFSFDKNTKILAILCMCMKVYEN